MSSSKKKSMSVSDIRKDIQRYKDGEIDYAPPVEALEMLMAEHDKLESFAIAVEQLSDEIGEDASFWILTANREPEFPASYFKEHLVGLINKHL